MQLNIRKATQADLPEIVRLLADDPFSGNRESYRLPVPESYRIAFETITADKNHHLIVAEIEAKVIGTLQLCYITHLIHQGSKHALIEGVRIDKNFRSKGYGKLMLSWAVQKAKEEGCHAVQLTSNKKRNRAIKFYSEIGFDASHEGLKLFF